jgi:3-deoxy-D-manno-octulosonic-acid transferase
LISATTGTGYHRILKCYPEHQAMGLPFDFSFCVASRLKKLKPDLIIFAELDLWPNFLTLCGDYKIPFLVVGGRISESSSKGYAKIKNILKEPLEAIRLFLAQDQVDADRAEMMGIPKERIKVGGNLKFDLLKTEAPILPTCLEPLKKSDRKWLILASTHFPEEEMMLKVIQKIPNFSKNWSLIIVPRHPERSSDVEKTMKEYDGEVIKFSALKAGKSFVVGHHLLIDEIGVLSSLYGLGDLCFVGGSLIPHGGQNMIEPAAMGCPVMFGLHVQNFREAVQLLINCGGAKQVKSLEECEKEITNLCSASEERTQMAKNARQAVISRQGVAKANLDEIQPFLNFEA